MQGSVSFEEFAWCHNVLDNKGVAGNQAAQIVGMSCMALVLRNQDCLQGPLRLLCFVRRTRFPKSTVQMPL